MAGTKENRLHAQTFALNYGYEMTTPTIHLNGTGAKPLVDQYVTACEAVQNAMDAMSNSAPNGRDYYPQGADAIGKAVTEHNSRVARLQSVWDELQSLAIHCHGFVK